jgi:hypothetical protein
MHQQRETISCITVQCLCCCFSYMAICTFKWLTNMQQFSLCFCSCKIIQKSVSYPHLHYRTEMVKYTLDQRVLLYDTYMKNISYKSCKRRFCHKHPGEKVAASSTTFELVKKVRSTGSFLHKKYNRQNAVLRKSLTKLETD